MNTSKELRELVKRIRIKPIPIKDVIPALTKAADELDSLNEEIEVLKKFVQMEQQ